MDKVYIGYTANAVLFSWFLELFWEVAMSSIFGYQAQIDQADLPEAPSWRKHCYCEVRVVTSGVVSILGNYDAACRGIEGSSRLTVPGQQRNFSDGVGNSHTLWNRFRLLLSKIGTKAYVPRVRELLLLRRSCRTDEDEIEYGFRSTRIAYRCSITLSRDWTVWF